MTDKEKLQAITERKQEKMIVGSLEFNKLSDNSRLIGECVQRIFVILSHSPAITPETLRTFTKCIDPFFISLQEVSDKVYEYYFEDEEETLETE